MSNGRQRNTGKLTVYVFEVHAMIDKRKEIPSKSILAPVRVLSLSFTFISIFLTNEMLYKTELFLSRYKI